MTVGGPCGHQTRLAWCSSLAGSPCIVVAIGKGRLGARRLSKGGWGARCRGAGRSQRDASGSHSPVKNITIKTKFIFNVGLNQE